MRILIVEDTPSTAQILEAYIKDILSDYKDLVVCRQDNVREACLCLVENEVSLLFQDIHLNDLEHGDGFTVADFAIAQGIPVVVVTSDNSLDTMKKVANRDYDRFIMKPVTRCEVETALSRCLGIDIPHKV